MAVQTEREMVGIHSRTQKKKSKQEEGRKEIELRLIGD